MPYGETKVYFDGSHYIAIPHTTRPSRPRPKRKEEPITVIEENQAEKENATEESALSNADSAPIPPNDAAAEEGTVREDNTAQNPVQTVKTERKTTRKELFEKFYAESLCVKKSERRNRIVKAMRPYFKDETAAQEYVDVNMERKLRNLIYRRIRLTRKINLQDFNFFVTFTYDGALHTETSFRKKLKNRLSQFSSRKAWKYVGVWERSPEKKRLHFHGLFSVPEGTLPGELTLVDSYSFKTHKRQQTSQNSYFLREFGRNDFEPIYDKRKLMGAVAYLMKYIEKSGEKIVYSKGLPQYFISDIMDEDIVCRIGLEDKKLLLYDDFQCWDEGCLMGRVSKDVIAMMRKSN